MWLLDSTVMVLLETSSFCRATPKLYALNWDIASEWSSASCISFVGCANLRGIFYVIFSASVC